MNHQNLFSSGAALLLASAFVLVGVSLPAQAATTPQPDDVFTFDDSFQSSEGTNEVQPNEPCSDPLAGLSPCNAASSFGAVDGDGYWGWQSTDNANGGGFFYNPPRAVGDSYTIFLKFQITDPSLGDSYNKIVDYANLTSDTGFYLYNSEDPSWQLEFYSEGENGSGTSSFDVTDMIDVAIVRDASSTPATFRAYVRTGGGPFAQEFTFNDLEGESLPFVDTDGHTVLGFFGEDGNAAEAALGGRIFDLRFWYDRALTEGELNAIRTSSLDETTQENAELAETGIEASSVMSALTLTAVFVAGGALMVARNRKARRVRA
jgi:hypothetical protein